MKKKILAIVLCVAMLAIAIVGGTMAYFTDTKSATNTMAVGSVKIEQHEQERVKDADGNYTAALQNFTQNQPVVPAVGTIAWGRDMGEAGIVVDGVDYKAFHSGLKNVIDKVVTVENTGKSAAYVRTIIAIEDPFTANRVHVNVNGDKGVISQSAWMVVEIDGVPYSCTVFTYDEALASGTTSAPSLVQLFLNPATTNEDVACLGEKWDVIALSQAVQADGFADPSTALNEAFGEANEANILDWLTE